MKKAIAAVISLTAVVIIVLASCLASADSSLGDVKRSCTAEIYSALYDLREKLPFITEKNTALREDMLCDLARLDSAVRVAESLYAETVFGGNHGFDFITELIGSGYSAEINGKTIESVFYDGKLSEGELEYISMLTDSIDILLEPLLAEDGMNLNGAKYDDIRDGLAEFLDKWCSYDTGSLPLSLLVR